MNLGLESIDYVRMMVKQGLVAKLRLSVCSIGNAGLQKLLDEDAIKDSLSLVELDLSCNGLTGKGISKLCEALVHNKSISHVNLSSH